MHLFGMRRIPPGLSGKPLESGKRAAVPKVEGKRLMEFYYINGTEELTPGYRGIPEPAGDSERKAFPGKKALMVMPGAAFDLRRHAPGVRRRFL